MSEIRPDETEIYGESRLEGRRVVNEAASRIENLINSGYLVRIAADQTGWEQLFRDPSDGRYWELTYPHGELHGGGPPKLRVMAEEAAKSKYGAGKQQPLD